MAAFESSPRVTPFLWFDNRAEEAVDFYLSIFPNSRKLQVMRTGAEGPGPANSVLTLGFELDGQPFTALNGGPLFQFTEAVSFVVRCDSQQEVDHYWDRLCEGGTPGRCCWLKDKFGLSWQVVPARLPELIRHPAAMRAMMTMSKPDIAALERAAQS